MIKSFQEINTNKFTILLEENPLSDIYNEVVLTYQQEKEIVEILTKNKNGKVKNFDILTKIHMLTISDYVDLTEE